MNYYLSKYVGTYRIKAEINQSVNDFCRDKNGNLDNEQDIYIKCAKRVRVYYYGNSILEVYIPSIGTGRNIIKEIYARYINPNNTEVITNTIVKKNGESVSKKKIIIIDKKLFAAEINESDLIFDIEETDEEILFKVKDKNFEKIAEIISPLLSGASISPFSPKNLPKVKLNMTPTQIQKYKEIIDKIPKEDKLVIGKLNNQFLSTILCKKLRLKLDVLKQDMKKEQMKTKDYIYFKGYEDDYLKFLEINI